MVAFFWQLTKGLDVKKQSEITKQIITNQNLLSEKNIENHKVELVGKVNSEYYFFLDNRLNNNSLEAIFNNSLLKNDLDDEIKGIKKVKIFSPNSILFPLTFTL